MRKLFDVGEETSGGGSDSGNQTTPVTPVQQERAPTQDEQFAQIKEIFNAMAPKNRMLIDPRAAAALPEDAQAKILAMGKSGMALLGGTAPQFPFAAWAQQHQPTVSPNTKN